MRPFLVDTLATVVFFTVVAAFTELVVAGLEPVQVLIARALTIPVMVATGRPYGAWRDRVLRRLRPRGRAGRAAADTLAFLSFQVPVYVAVLALAGAEAREIAVAVGAALGFMLASARPFGLFLEAMRRRFGVAPPATLSGGGA